MRFPERVTELQIRRKLPDGGPKDLQLVLVGTPQDGRMYKRDADGTFVRLGDGDSRPPEVQRPTVG